MESTSSRLILEGSAYDYLFPKPLYKDETINSSADVSDTVSFIQTLIPKTLSDTRKLVEEVLWEKELKKFCSKAWHFAYHHIPYKRDKDGVEQVRRPARAWSDRKKGGIDCDCYSVFLGSCLFNAGIKFHLRIAKYPKKPPETPYWQHIYIVVPKDQQAGYSMDSKDDYWVMDCVKERFNIEEPYLEFKDYPMRLDYLNGVDSDKNYKIPQSVDAQDLASTNDIDELGELGQWLQASELGKAPKSNGKRKQVFKKGFKAFNRFLNPATIALRNSVLLAMKVNFLKIASKIRFGYLSDQQAVEKGLHPEKFASLKKIKQKVEDIYQKAGGKKENFRKAILKGHGNKDKAVPINGLDGIEQLYGEQDDDENLILEAQGENGLEEVYGLGALGVVSVAAGLAAATAVLTPIAAVLSKVKGLFPKNAAQGAEFDSQPDSNDTAAISDSQPLQVPMPYSSMKPENITSDPIQNEQENNSLSDTLSKNMPIKTNTPQEVDKQTESSASGFGKAIAFAKKNPIVTTLFATALGYGIYKLTLAKKTASKGLSGFSHKKKKKRKGKTKTGTATTRARLTHKKILAVKLR